VLKKPQAFRNIPVKPAKNPTIGDVQMSGGVPVLKWNIPDRS